MVGLYLVGMRMVNVGFRSILGASVERKMSRWW